MTGPQNGPQEAPITVKTCGDAYLAFPVPGIEAIVALLARAIDDGNDFRDVIVLPIGMVPAGNSNLVSRPDGQVQVDMEPVALVAWRGRRQRNGAEEETGQAIEIDGLAPDIGRAFRHQGKGGLLGFGPTEGRTPPPEDRTG